MITVVKFIAMVVAGELLLHMLLFFIGKWIGKQNRDRITITSFLKGLIERAFVVVALRTEVASALTLLAALKIATRFKDEENKVSNDFFLMGNLISILFGIGYYQIMKAEF
jgi:hypothetical protein